MKPYSEEFKAEVLLAYQDKSIPFTEITATYGVTTDTVIRWARKAGVPLRTPERGKRNASTGDMKICSKCKKKIQLKDARYCPYCAADVRSPKMIVIEQLAALCTKAMIVPDSIRDEFITTINAAVAELKK